jgi:hypothetical protein
MNNRALNMIKTWLGSFLQDHDFSAIELRDSDSFGNSIAIFESKNVRLRAILDKNQLCIEIGSINEPEVWYDLQLISLMLKSSSSEPISDPKEQVNFLVNNYSGISYLFSDENLIITKNELNTLKKERTLRMFPHLFRPKR